MTGFDIKGVLFLNNLSLDLAIDQFLHKLIFNFVKDIPMIIRMRMMEEFQNLLDHDQLTNEKSAKNAFIEFSKFYFFQKPFILYVY